MAEHSGRASATLAVTSVLLTVCVLGSGTASAAAGPSLVPPAVLHDWAYGVLKSVHFHGLTGSYAYEGGATFGLSVVFNETRNSTDGQITVNVVRTIGALIEAKYCAPDCAAPHAVANFTFHAFETAHAWANLTTQWNVTEPGPVRVPALALENSSLAVSAKLRESGEYSRGHTVLREKSLGVNVTGAMHVNLTRPLGLIPESLAPGDSWGSSSSFVTTGHVDWSWFFTSWGSMVMVPDNGTNHSSASLITGGLIAIEGNYSNGSNVSFGGVTYPAINLTVVGPFALGEGVVLVPVSADLFASGSQPWSGKMNGSTVVTVSRVDVHPGRFFNDRLPIIASAYEVQNTTGNVAAVAGGGGGPSPALAPQAASNSTVVQGQPESVAQAQSDQACLVTGVGCGSPLGPHLPVRFFVLLGAAAVIAAVLSVTLVARRRPPAPVYPNSALYPPGAAAGSPRPAPAPQPTEEDPLGHLW